MHRGNGIMAYLRVGIHHSNIYFSVRNKKDRAHSWQHANPYTKGARCGNIRSPDLSFPTGG